MLQLLKITFIAFSLLFIANISHANTCANDLSECTPKNLCEIATVKSDGIFSWSHLSKAKKHVTLAKNLGMDCGVTVVTDLCDTNPYECKINLLCEKATKVVNGTKAWNTSAQEYIDVAKKYNLSCDVETKIIEKSCVQEPKNCNDTQLCDMGVVHGAEAKTWDTTSKWIKHANEAKMRGLSCGVGVRTSLDIDKKLMNEKKFHKFENVPTSFLHIAIPVTKKFNSNVLKLYKQFMPECIVIHSTISPGTTNQLQKKLKVPLIFSATRGVHKRMIRDLKRYTKFFAISKNAPKKNWAVSEYNKTMKHYPIVSILVNTSPHSLDSQSHPPSYIFGIL